ncbi:hypothetical protein B0H13DRAFT_2296810 [Mycena leptocephala]|nr:hypothetical protein B0H13DRAFT_2296810 [Mycena leptocephala]
MTFERDILELKTKLARLEGNLNLRTGIEIVSSTLKIRAGLGGGVQSVIDAIVTGKFDAPAPATPKGLKSVTYTAARTAIVNKMSPSHYVEDQLVDKVSKELYHELSKHMHGSEGDPIEIREGDHTQTETIAAMSVFLFVRRLIPYSLDLRYTSTTGKLQFLISELV